MSEERRAGERRVGERRGSVLGPGFSVERAKESGVIWSFGLNRRNVTAPRRSGSDRRASAESPRTAVLDSAVEGEGAGDGGSLVEGGRCRIIETEGGPLDLGEHYESVYILAEALVEGFDFDHGDALGQAIEMVNRYELTDHLRTEASR